METPKSNRKLKLVRIHTPKLSDRKKNLFENVPKTPIKDIEETLLEGIEFLDDQHDFEMGTLKATQHDIKMNCDIKCVNESEIPTRRSLRSNSNCCSNLSLMNRGNCKENKPNTIPIDDIANDQFHDMFNSSMRLDCDQMGCSNKIQKAKRYGNYCKEESKSLDSRKRASESHETISVGRQKKLPKLSSETFSTISTKKFYSTPVEISPPKMFVNSQCENTTRINSDLYNRDTSARPRSRDNRCSKNTLINRGVKHKIRRTRVSLGTTSTQRSLSSADIDIILKNMHNEKLRKIINSKREERKQIEKVHNILRNSKNPIAMARPLSTISGINSLNNNKLNSTYMKNTIEEDSSMFDSDEANFSETEWFSDNDNYSENKNFSVNTSKDIPLIPSEHLICNIKEKELLTPSARKFFKSDRITQTPKEITITENIKASLCNGKISLLQDEKKSKKKVNRRISVATEFSDEQAAVNAILENLNNSNIFSTTGISRSNSDDYLSTDKTDKDVNDDDTTIELKRQEQLSTSLQLADFRKRIPYNTNDPEKIEQQLLLLEFLIDNNMCTEENFIIFIGDPDNHKEEAARIVDQVFVLVNEQQNISDQGCCATNNLMEHRNQPFDGEEHVNHITESNNETSDQIPFQTENLHIESKEVTSNKNTEQREEYEIILNTNFNVENNLCKVDSITESQANENNDKADSLFSIFDKTQWKPLQQKAKRNLPRTWSGGEGINQYQIDAGQRHFGAQQCKQCGLVYSIHEPEEEKLHREYHSSLHVLRFKGWIDEDIVAIYPEWSADGRILRITENANIRKHERLADILKIVDKELGFSSYIIPKIFVAYMAIRKYQIVGLCLVEPLKKAHKYINVNGVDCYSQEEFPAICGISRIWVSPLHRRLHIASKLIQIVQQNTVFGEEIPLNRIAFSAPTEYGKLFAQNITMSENFLVYQ